MIPLNLPQLDRLEMREIRLVRKQYFVSSRTTTKERRIILICVVDRGGEMGWSECSAPEGPYYNEEWTDSAWLTLQRFLIPLIPECVKKQSIPDVFNKVRGHKMAKACLESALTDLSARKANIPIYKLLGGQRREIESGISIGIQDT